MDGNVAIYRRYNVDISGVGHSQHDISKRKSNEGKIEKYRPIVQWSHIDLHYGFEISLQCNINVYISLLMSFLHFYKVFP